MTFALLASIALSLATTNEYHFSIPATTNLAGKTYVLDGGRVPRFEDIAFLREAYMERNAAIMTRPYYVDPGVSNTLAFAAGRLDGNIMPRVYFSPSFGLWGGYTAYQSGFFLKPGVTIATDYRETDDRYLWDGVDTSMTNTIAAFVDPGAACVDTNGIIGATLEALVCVSNLVAAYSPMTNRYCVLTRGSIYSHQGKQIKTSFRQERHAENDRYTSYTYPRYDGRTMTGSYLSSFDVTDWADYYSTTTTNAAPVNPGSYEIRSIRERSRRYGWRYTYEAQNPRESTYDVFQVGSDYDCYKSDGDELNGLGNTLATDDKLDAPLTNTIQAVKGVVVCRFRIVKTDRYSNLGHGMKSPPATVVTTNHFVTVAMGNASRTADRFSGLTVWDTGVSVVRLMSDIANGYDLRTWALACPYPVLDCDPNINRLNPYARHERIVTITPVDILPYFYYRRRWNARIPTFDN